MRKVVFILLIAFSTQPLQSLAQHSNDSAHTVPPFKIFDNLYYVGTDFVSAYVLTTKDGNILIDALHGRYTEHIFSAMKTLGLDPMQIKYILCTHAHYDHLEGAEAIQQQTHARIGMTDADWQIVEGKLKDDYTSLVSFPKRDLVIKDNTTLKLGGTTLHLYVTPGHTQGVLSIAFPVKDGDRTYHAFMLGGVGLNFHGIERTEQYLASIERIMAMKDIQVNISNHPDPGKIFERAKLLETRRPGDPHPFVAPDDFSEWLRQLHKKAEEKLANEKKL